MDKSFRHQLSRLPFLTAMLLAIAGMPLDVFAYNQRGLGHAHSLPWLSKATAAITGRVSRLMAALKSPLFWRVALTAAVLLLVVLSSHAHATAGSGVMGALTIPELLQKKGELVNEANEVLAKMGDQPRAEDETKFDAIHVDIEKITKQVARMQKQEEVTKATDESQGRSTKPAQPNDGSHGRRAPSSSTAEHFSDGIRSWFLAGSDHERTQEMRDSASRCGFNLEQRSVTLRLPAKPPRSARGAVLDEWEKRAAMGTTSGAVGGYTVPNEAMRPLEAALLAYGAMRGEATVIRTDSGASLPLPTSNDTTNKGAILTENSAASEVDVTFGQLTLDAYKYSSKYLLISVELLQDSAVNVAEWIGQALGIRIGRITNDHFTTGTGSSQPNGLVTAATLGKTAAAVATVTYDEMVDLIHSVDPAYRDNGEFMFHDGGLKMLKKIKVLQYSGDATGIPLWSPGLSPGQPDSILGYPYVVNQSMTTPATGVKSILFGDFSKYIIRDVRDITLIRLDERFAEYHQVAYLAFSRHDGDLLDAGTHPVSYLIQA